MEYNPSYPLASGILLESVSTRIRAGLPRSLNGGTSRPTPAYVTANIRDDTRRLHTSLSTKQTLLDKLTSTTVRGSGPARVFRRRVRQGSRWGDSAWGFDRRPV